MFVFLLMRSAVTLTATIRKWLVSFRLALDSADGQAGDEVLLEEGVDAGDRNCHDEGDCHTNGLLGHSALQVGGGHSGNGVLGQVVQVVLHLVQGSLQGQQVIAADVQTGLEPVIPVAEGQEQTDGSQNGLGDGQHDPEENGHLGCAVDLCRLDDGVGNCRLEEGTGNGTVPAGNSQRKHQRPYGILQFQDLGVDNVGSSQTAAEDHGNENHDGQEAVQAMLLTGQNVTHEAGQGDTDDGTHGGNVDGDPQSTQNSGSLAPDELVSAGGEFLCGDPDLITLTGNDIVIRNGDHEDEDDGQEAAQCQNQEECIEDKVGYRVDTV